VGALCLRVGVAAEERRNRDEALRWLRFVGLEEKANEAAGELSLRPAEVTDAGVLSGHRGADSAAR